MENEYIIGLDLGINNVGYSVIDFKTKKIIKKGVRLYSPANKADNRRRARNDRRRRKRKSNRIAESLKLFERISFPKENTVDTDLLEKRVKGLTKKLDKQDIVNIVCYFMSHRGYIPFGDENRTLVDLSGKYPCEYYKELYQSISKYRALDEVVNHKDLQRELNTILITQSKFYPELKEIIGNEGTGLLWIFSRKRKFWEGPGSVNSFSPYGRFKSQKDVEEYNKMKSSGKEKYLFEDLIGRCNIYPDEKCAPKANFYAEKFNLLNDFINIKIINPENIKSEDFIMLESKNTYKLSTKALEEIVDYCIKHNGSLSYKNVLKNVLGLTTDDIIGYRIDRKGKPEFSLFNVLRYVQKMYNQENLDCSWLIDDNYKNYNILMNYLAVSPGIVETEKMMSSIHNFSKEERDVINSIQNKLKKDGSLQYHALSEKALKRATNDMIINCLNYMQVSRKFDYEKEVREMLIKNYGSGEGTLLMTTKYIDDIVASPQVKKTLRQSIKIINAIIKEQGGHYPKVIAIESTKEMNGQAKSREIQKEQKLNEKLREDAIALLENYVGDDKITPKMVDKAILFQELNGECPYCGESLNINDVIDVRVDIEHIIPISRSADNSKDNKTLSCSKCNDKKGNKTPYEFLGDKEFLEFEKRVSNLSKITEKKMQNFLTKENFDKHKIRFFNRSLRDTAYATKELVNQVKIFNMYLKTYLEDTEINTLSTPGNLTSDIRKKWSLPKNRDDGKYHHAVDASIVGGIATTELGKNIIRLQNEPKYFVLNKEEIQKIPDLLENFDYIADMKKEIMNIKSDDDILISTQVNKDPVRNISNANICSFIKTEDKYRMIQQIDNIYAADLYRKEKDTLNKLFDEENKDVTLLCQENNPKLFNKLKNIYNNYQVGNSNPFLNYCEEVKESSDTDFNYLEDGIKTDSKNGKGVLVKKLRYMKNVETPFLLNKKNIHKKGNTLIGLDSVSIFCTRLFWDKDNEKIIFIPVYIPCVDSKTKKINVDHPLYRTYYDKFVKGKSTQFIVDLFNGDYVEITKSNGNVIKENVKSYSKSNKSIQCKSGRYLSPKDTFTLYGVDILGNKYKRLTWPKKEDIM